MGGDPARVLFDLAPRLTRLENAVLGRMKPPLTFRQYRLLLRVAEGHTSLTALGRVATISLAAVSESVDGLVERGLLTRQPDAKDRRVVLLKLTRAGRGALLRGGKVLTAMGEDLLEGVDGDERAQLDALLRRVEQRINARLPR